MRDLRHDEIQRLLIMANKRGKSKLRCSIYARKSRLDTLKTSIDTQVSECKAFISKNSSLLTLEEGAIFFEDNVSGMSDERPEFQKLMTALKNQEYDVLIVTKVDRFSRDSQNTLKYLTLIEQYGGYFIAFDDFGDNSAAGILIKQVMWATSEFLVRRSVEDGMRVKGKRVKDGYSAGGVGNYGYRVIGKKYEIDPLESAAVYIVYDRFLHGCSYQEIINELETLGFKSRSGKRFSFSSIHGILTNVRNTGMNVWNSTAKRKVKKRVSKIDFEEVVCSEATTSIISKEDFDKVQAMLKLRATHRPNRAINHAYLLTSFINCKGCGSSMVGNSYRSGRDKTPLMVYSCPKHTKKKGGKCSTKNINALYLEQTVKDLVTEVVNKNIKNPTNPINPIDLVAKVTENNLRHQARCKSEILRLTHHEQRLLDILYAAPSDVLVKRTEAELAKSKLAKDKWLDVMNSSSVHTQAIHQGIHDHFKSGFSTEELFDDVVMARYLISTLIEGIEINNEQVNIRFF
jgi:site-specific DNA recombinase